MASGGEGRRATTGSLAASSAIATQSKTQLRLASGKMEGQAAASLTFSQRASGGQPHVRQVDRPAQALHVHSTYINIYYYNTYVISRV